MSNIIIDKEDRLIDDTNSRTYNTKATLLYLDDLNPTDLTGATVVVDGPVPVYDGDEKVGSANIYTTDTQVIADLFLAYDTPVRLDIETQARPVYAVPIGTVAKFSDDSVFVHIDSVKLVNKLPEGSSYINLRRLA